MISAEHSDDEAVVESRIISIDIYEGDSDGEEEF